MARLRRTTMRRTCLVLRLLAIFRRDPFGQPVAAAAALNDVLPPETHPLLGKRLGDVVPKCPHGLRDRILPAQHVELIGEFLAADRHVLAVAMPAPEDFEHPPHQAPAAHDNHAA